MSDHVSRLAAEIRRHVTDLNDGDSDGHDNLNVWWPKRDPALTLPEALAADLIAAGWRHWAGDRPDGAEPWITAADYAEGWHD